MEIVIFSLDDKKYAIPISQVVRVMLTLEITPMPETIPCVLGIIDLHGKKISVVSLREVLSIPEKKMEIDNVLIILTLHDHQMAILVDEIVSTINLELEDGSEIEALFPNLVTSKVVKLESEIIPVLDIDLLLDHELKNIIKK